MPEGFSLFSPATAACNLDGPVTTGLIMNGLTKILALSLLAGAASGCSTARIALSPHLAAATEPLALTGMGYGETGRFAVAGSSGSFTRKALESRQLAPFTDDATTHYRGGGSYSISGPDVAGTVSATCRYHEDEVDAGALVTTVERFRYRCAFARDGRPIDADLRLAAVPRSPGKLLSAATRAGRLRVGGQTLMIEPIHHMVGTRLPSGDPLGYRFIRDGREIGAVDLNGERKTVFAPRHGPDREAVLIGSVALSILWHS